MRKLFSLFALGCIFFLSCNSSNKEDDDSVIKLKEKIKERFGGVEGDFAIAFKSLTSDSTSLFLKEKENFHAASTMKTPVMIELYKQVAIGNLSLEDSVEIINEFKSIVDGSPYAMDLNVDSQEGLYHKIGQKTTFRELNYQMITMSSNLATNILIDHLDAKKVTQTMRDMGAADILVLRGVEDLKAYELGMSNTTTAVDLMILMESIATGKAVSEQASDEMFKVLLDQHFNELIPAHLPDDVIVAHKTGSITGVQHDSGIVRLPNGDQYVLVILSKNLSSIDDGVKAIADVSKMIYDFVTKNEKSN
ncbi:serine hydrolase [Echinicola sp. CAU 1574]|uniref:beta-lactamase n=1 Tax=Echinicola arenosa TaxID=2774144 RepID=A0ABR9AM75_9BACT|nr:serine hydrolase [Echinicola arenosa]MBD8489911.1 serine hydrolase [Echinicola arenosa]